MMKVNICVALLFVNALSFFQFVVLVVAFVDIQNRRRDVAMVLPQDPTERLYQTTSGWRSKDQGVEHVFGHACAEALKGGAYHAFAQFRGTSLAGLGQDESDLIHAELFNKFCVEPFCLFASRT